MGGEVPMETEEHISVWHLLCGGGGAPESLVAFRLKLQPALEPDRS
jgi:hypothetical protein